jgi:hypothetical protein
MTELGACSLMFSPPLRWFVARNDGVRKGSGYLVFCLRVAAAKLALAEAGETYGSRVMVFLDAYSLFIQQSLSKTQVNSFHQKILPLTEIVSRETL